METVYNETLRFELFCFVVGRAKVIYTKKALNPDFKVGVMHKPICSQGPEV